MDKIRFSHPTTMTLVKKLSFLWSYSLLVIIVGGFYAGGPAWAFAGMAYIYIGIPVLDALFGLDRRNVTGDQYEEVLNDRFFDVLVYSFVYIHYGLLIWGGYVLLTVPMTGWQQFGLMTSIGLFGGSIINVAHELGHRSSRVAQIHAKLALVSVSYGQFFIEHNRGHHVHVATPHDPATARRGQSVYAFWWQSITGGYRSAWQIEAGLLARKGQRVWSRHNELLRLTLAPAGLLLLLTAGFSVWLGAVAWIIPVFFVRQSVMAILLLESVNYIEHYGIVRAETGRAANGSVRYERVNPLHSWNASQLISNLVLFQLQRHSDHHAYASRPYQVLRHFDESPQLPFGYPLMIIISLVPPLWFRLMDARLDRWKADAVDAARIGAVVRQMA
jgi:alkane 1-monooxygenase